MAKVLKVKATRKTEGGATHYTYPSVYKAKQVNVLTYESKEDRLKRTDKDTCQYLICVVSDKVGNIMLKSSDDITELSDTEAKSLGGKWRPQVETITDQNKVISLTAKSAMGDTLTQKEKDALNPQKDEIGINKSKHFDDILKDAKTKADK